ncbi:MAG: hypothetical protein ACLVFI_08565 [Christensenellales bacterium]
MLDEKRVKLMTKLALYEETQGNDDFKVSGYYRKDYVGMHMIGTFLWVTIGYVCLAGLLVLAGMDAIISKMSVGFLITLMIVAVAGYFVLLILFLSLTSRIYNKKHQHARNRVKMYNHDLIKLLKMYEKEKR